MGAIEKKQQILESAYNLFIESGYENTKISDIAKNAGIGKSTVYDYFKTKNEIFGEMFNSYIADDYIQITTLVENSTSAREKLISFAKFEISNRKKWGSVFKMLYLDSDSFLSEAINQQNALLSLMKLRFSILVGIVSKGIATGEFKNVNPLLVTTSLMGALNFLLIYDPTDSNQSFLSKEIEGIIKSFDENALGDITSFEFPLMEFIDLFLLGISNE